MATLAFAAIGSAVGGALLPAGLSAFGATITGAAIGQAAGSLVGGYVDQALFGSSGQSKVTEGARLSDLQVTSSTEGSDIPRVYGRVRLSGQIIWATNFEEQAVTSTQSSGGGKGLSGGGQSVQRTDYLYYANFAVAVAEGEITRIGRIWADGKELDLSGFIYRVYRGTEDQLPDSLIEAKEGTDNAPAYRGTAYVVFERMPLARFGNRLPQLSFEIFRSVDSFESQVRAVTLIPGAGEFVYEKDQITRDGGGGLTISENVHTRLGGSDWDASLDQLEEALPNTGSVSLIASWFGSDLRAAQCTLRPGVETQDKVTAPDSWGVSGVARSTAYVVSTKDGRPAFGGTPSDASIVSAIQDLKARGFKVTFYPFILMDVPEGNSLTDPYTGASSQPVYPWRGRITVDPAPGEAGSPDKTAAAATQISSFLGTAAVSDYAIAGTSVTYSGPAEWTYRRMILHYAHLCKAAGGVDAFLIGSELRGLTQVRESASGYPFVSDLVQLAADVKTVLGSGTKVTYAADWSEYFGHHPSDGTGDVYFHLDPLWSASDIDAIGIDVYWPLADWRDGENHLDYQAGTRSIYDPDYLKGNIFGGEGFDWFYASQTDRDNQTRTVITDGAAAKPWVFRFKDIRSWWQNQHYNRPGGIENASPTAWVPESKPIWFTEIGCPVVDKGANQPNVFIDPKSSESAFPYYSRGTRDDTMQRRYLQAFHEFFDPGHANYVTGSNPQSGVFTGRMVDVENIAVYTWDARPFPAFPNDVSTWGDAANWTFGHWLTGRVADAPLAETVRQILEDFGFSDFDAVKLSGVMDGYVIDRIMSARSALQPLELSFFFDSFESADKIKFAHRGQRGVQAQLTLDDLVEEGAETEVFTLTRRQETELPLVAKVTYIDGAADYRQAAVEARRLIKKSERIATAQLPIVMGQARAQNVAESWLYDAWAAREQAQLALPPSRMGLEPSDVIELNANGRGYRLRITETAEALDRKITALSIEPGIFSSQRAPERTASIAQTSVFGPAIAAFLDLPLLSGDEVPHAGYVAAYQSPWPGSVAFYRSPDTTGFDLNTLARSPATIGITEEDFYSGPTSRWDRGNTLRVKLDNGWLQSLKELAVFGGGNVAAIENADGEWEVIQFRDAVLVDENTYDLSNFLRGQAGTEKVMRDPVLAGARFVLLDGAVGQVDMTVDEIGLSFNWKYGPANRDINHVSYQDESRSFSGLALKPLSPVHVKGARNGNDLDISWVRRTRVGGDSWETTEVPLGEGAELYEVDILDGATVKRTLSATSPAITYTEAEQQLDFGSVQSFYDVKVYQLSSAYGRGVPREATV